MIVLNRELCMGFEARKANEAEKIISQANSTSINAGSS
jgi:hypothetical protein